MAASEISVNVTDIVYSEYSKMVDKLVSPVEVTHSQLKLNPQYAHLLHAALGICGEAGEVADQVKKATIYGRELDKVNMVEELGDVLWYLTLMCNLLGVTLSQVMMVNTEKLKKRYPHQWDAEKEQNRDLTTERATLESAVNQTPKE